MPSLFIAFLTFGVKKHPFLTFPPLFLTKKHRTTAVVHPTARVVHPTAEVGHQTA
ncbi:MAG TPA: hypothetical protein VF411_04995 [Bacteroidia bacterium]